MEETLAGEGFGIFWKFGKHEVSVGVLHVERNEDGEKRVPLENDIGGENDYHGEKESGWVEWTRDKVRRKDLEGREHTYCRDRIAKRECCNRRRRRP